MSNVKVVYWPGFSGRAEPIFFLLEAAKQAYVWDEDVSGFKAGNKGAPVFACPFLEQGGVVMSQTTAILVELGNQFGFAPKAGESGTALMMSLNLGDVWAEAYTGRKGADKGDSFLSTRLPQWIQVLDGLAVRTSSGEDFLFGNDPTYVDFQLLNLVNVLEFMYGDPAAAQLRNASPRLHRIAQNVRALPAIAAYVASDRYKPVLYPSIRAELSQ
mmetsp:Transcript_7696/g.21838  ORF Transcript_7696/g.21838 Transcript_7696/m.21838 type:complete len:215 (+) Transcript_7696:25-669(+)|eukprot:CAMPEP_0119137608 /NCGR_PEP_ID=MMETSP1310-20130426/23970_1 /TAXON_ID=464262 /ORGANISM="Genus nov. species nov., Strain RCC2339" /LENGTH=214 /DNA_ID=CAMNT_0007128713 /DNA_START=8 /DNA_END=652 /DNA_ORIENTATION=+